MSRDYKAVIFALFALASVIIGGGAAFMCDRGTGGKADLPQKLVPETVEPEIDAAAPEKLANGAVKSLAETHPNGREKSVEYYLTGTDGSRELVSRRTYFENGRLQTEMNIVEEDGKKLNHELSWHANGSKELDYYKYDGKFHGEYIEFWESGFTKKRGRFDQGLQEGFWYEWSNLGIRLFKSHYRNGRLHGPHTGWNSRGELAAEGAYRDGREAGGWIFYPTHENENLEKRTFPGPVPDIE